MISRHRLIAIALWSACAVTVVLDAEPARAQCRGQGASMQSGTQQNMLRSMQPTGGQNSLVTDLMQQNMLLQQALTSQQQNILRAGQQQPAGQNLLVAGGRQQQNDPQRLDQQAEDLFDNPARQAGKVIRLVGTPSNLRGQQLSLDTAAGTIPVLFRDAPPARLSQLIQQQPEAVTILEGTIRVKDDQPILTRARLVRVVNSNQQVRRAAQ